MSREQLGHGVVSEAPNRGSHSEIVTWWQYVQGAHPAQNLTSARAEAEWRPQGGKTGLLLLDWTTWNHLQNGSFMWFNLIES